eukprot:gene9590-10577_t
MPTVSPAVAAKQLLAVVGALFSHTYVLDFNDPKKFADTVGFVVNSTIAMGKIVNSTGLNFQDVNRTLTNLPLNMLDSYENRLGYAAVFALVTLYCITVLFGSVESILGTSWGKIIKASPSYVSFIFKMVATVVISISAYPLFTCITTRHKVAGACIGLLYSLLWLGIYLWTQLALIILCRDKKREVGIILFYLTNMIPQVLALCILIFQFIRQLYVGIQRRRGKWLQDAADVHDDFKTKYFYGHVKNLLKAVTPTEEPQVKETFKVKLKRRLYTWRPDFKYSVRVVCAFAVSGITIFYLTLFFMYFTWYYVQYLIGSVVNSDDFGARLKLLNVKDKMIKDIRFHFKVATYSLYVAAILSALKSYLVFGNMLSLYRRHMIRLRRGDRTWLPKSVRTLSSSPSSLVSASMKYAGMQVACAGWSFVIFTFILWIAFVLIISVILYPLFNGESNFALALIYKFWPAALISFAVTFLQLLATKFCFLQQRGAIISINNRRSFHIMSYLLFFFNIFLGLFSCLLRILKGVIFGTLFLERVQKSILPTSFESTDPGYYAYIGYILTEHSHANPVLSVFFALLEKCMSKKKAIPVVLVSNSSTVGIIDTNGDVEMENSCFSKEKKSTKDRWKIVRNRWNVAYTLINNPTLAKYRKTASEEDSCSSIAKEAIDEKEGEVEYLV